MFLWDNCIKFCFDVKMKILIYVYMIIVFFFKVFFVVICEVFYGVSILCVGVMIIVCVMDVFVYVWNMYRNSLNDENII